MATKSIEEQQLTIQNLLPGKTYQFRVVPNTNFGVGDSSEVVYFFITFFGNIFALIQNSLDSGSYNSARGKYCRTSRKCGGLPHKS